MNAGDHADPKSPSLLRGFLGIIGVIVFAIVLAWALRNFVLQPYEIPSGSMETTIMIDDKVFSEKITYYVSDIKQGDIVTFEDTEIPGRILIKRVIATGGQTVFLQDGLVYVDGVALDEPYVNNKRTDPLTSSLVDIPNPYTIPQDSIWVMGDNRTNSKDSRYFGAVEVSRVTGKAFLTYWPLDRVSLLD